jgi:FdhD protein
VNASSSREPATPEGAVERTVQQRSPNGSLERRDAVASEMPVALHYNDAPFAVLMATPCDLADLALGFSLSEAIVESPGELRIDAIAESLEGMAISMAIPAMRADALEDRRRNLPGYGGCGVCGNASIESVLRSPPVVRSELRIAESALHRALAQLHGRQPLNAATGATHAAGFADTNGELRLVREDVGRHNALDTVIGHAFFAERLPLAGQILLVSGRVSFEIMQKALAAGIPAVCAVSAPSSLAVNLATEFGMTLVGFVRGDRFNVYAGAERFLDL